MASLTSRVTSLLGWSREMTPTSVSCQEVCNLCLRVSTYLVCVLCLRVFSVCVLSRVSVLSQITCLLFESALSQITCLLFDAKMSLTRMNSHARTCTHTPGDLVLGIEDCLYYYAVEDNQDRNRDGVPDFLGARVTDSISPATTAAVSGAIAGAVAGAVAASVAAAVGSAVTSAIGGAGAAGGSAAAGAAGGALTPLIMQAQFLGIAGQIGGKNALPTSASGLSGGLSWTNFHLPFKLYGKPDKPDSRRKLLAHRRQAAGATAVDKCAIIQQVLVLLTDEYIT